MKKLLQFLFTFTFLSHFVYGVDVSSITSIPSSSAAQNIPADLQITTPSATNTLTNTPQTQPMQNPQPLLPPVFGAHLFSGNFTQASQSLYNPDYKIAVGDKINFRMWGAVEFQQELMVDSQGNVFIPNVGAINLLGVRNGDLVKVLKKRHFKNLQTKCFCLCRYECLSKCFCFCDRKCQ